jgi:hypothetical protein
MKLISSGYEVLKDFARRGIIVKKLYATSRTPDGVRLCKDLGFTEKIVPGSDVRRFELDLETSNSPFAQEYQEIIHENKQTDKEVKRKSVSIKPQNQEEKSKKDPTIKHRQVGVNQP